MYGARPLKRLVQQKLETGLARKLLSGEVRDGVKVIVDAGPRGLAFEVKTAAAKAAAA
jgi:ATP-dependent Clp protease ATP-binding subunit ClpB